MARIKRTKNYVISQEGVRIPKAEYDLFKRQVASINRGLKMTREKTKKFERDSFLKYPNTVYNIPKNKSTSISTFKSLEDFRETVARQEVLRRQLLAKPRDLKSKGITKKLASKITKSIKQYEKIGKSFIEMRNQTYKNNMKKAIEDVFGMYGQSKLGNNLIDNIEQMSEGEFMKFVSTLPFELVSFVYVGKGGKNLPNLLENKYEEIMKYIQPILKDRTIMI